MRKWNFVLSLVAAMGIAGSAFAQQKFWVSATSSGEGNGSPDAPFPSLLHARDAIRAARKSGALARNVAVVVEIGPGNYRHDSTIEFTTEDSGTPEAPVTYRASQPGTVHIHGGEFLDPSLFHPLSDGAVRSRLTPAAQKAVLVCDLNPLIAGPIAPFKTSFGGAPDGPWLYENGTPMTLARWPNAGSSPSEWASFTKAVDSGLPDPNSDDPARRKLHPGSFKFDDPRPAKWNLEEGVWLLGYWTHDWRNETIRVAAYDQQQKVITLAAPHSYGIGQSTWGASARRFYAMNVLEELDAPGEWYLDRPAKQLYVYPRAKSGPGTMVLSVLQQPLIKMNGARHLKFEQLNFEYGHSAGLTIQNAEGVELSGCQIANFAHAGISLSGTGNTIRSCDLFNLGTTGISVSGGDRKTLTKAENLIVNNHIHDYALFQRTYAPAINVQGCGQIVRNNCLHDAPHIAVLYSGNEHLLEKNETYRVVMETGDAGAFYTGRDWTSQGNILRHNYIHDLGGGDAGHVNTMGIYLDDCDSGDTLDGNILVRAGRAFLIGGGRDNLILNNLVVDCPIGLHLDSRGMTWKQWNNPADPSWHLEAKAEALNYKSPPWSEKYPRLAAIMQESPREPLNNVIRRNVFINCSKEVCNFDKNVRGLLLKLEMADNLAVNTTGKAGGGALVKDVPGFENVTRPQLRAVQTGFSRKNAPRLIDKGNALIHAALPTFEPIPFHEIGLYVDEYRHELPKP